MATTYPLQNNQLPTKVSFTTGVLRPEDLNLAQNLASDLVSNSVSNLFRYGIVSNTDPTLNIGSLAVSFSGRAQSVQIDSGSAVFGDGIKYTQTNTEVIGLFQTAGVTNYILTLAKDEIPLTNRYNPVKDKIEDYQIGQKFSIKLLSRDEYDNLSTSDLINYIFLAELVPSGTGFQILSTSNRPWFVTPDMEHRSRVGTGTVSNSNIHGLSLNDLDPLPGMTFWDQLNLKGVISNLQSAYNRGDLVTQTIVPTELLNNLYSHPSCRVATTNVLSDSVVYAEGSGSSAGVGATLTNDGVQAILSIDDTDLVVGDRVLVKNQTDDYQNGIYVVTDLGSVSSNWVLTRAEDFNSPNNIASGDLIEVNEGLTNFDSLWKTKLPNSPIIGDSSITFSLFTGIAATGVSFILNKGATYVLSVIDSNSGNNLNFTYNRATKTVTCYPGYTITSNLTVSAIVINIGNVTQRIGSGSIIEIESGVQGEFLISDSASINTLTTTELNIQGLAGAVNEYLVYATNSGTVKISPAPIVQTNLFQLQNTVQGTIYLPENNYVNIAVTNFKVPSTFTLQLEIIGSAGTEIISIADPDTAFLDTTYTSFTIPSGTDLTTSGSEIEFFSTGSQWIKTANQHSYITSINVISGTNIPTTLGFLITQDATTSNTVNLATVKLSNKGNVYTIIDLREQKIFTEKPYSSIFYENFYNPLNFNPSISSSVLNSGLYKSTWYSRPIKLDAGIYKVVIAMNSIDELPEVGYTTDFGFNIINFQTTKIEGGLNHKVYTFSLTQTEYVSLYISTENSKETKIESLSLDILQTPVNVQFGMPTGVYEGFEPFVDETDIILTPDTDSRKSLASLSYQTGTFYYQKNDDVIVPSNARGSFDRIDLVALKYKDKSIVPEFVVIEGQVENKEPILEDDIYYDEQYSYLIMTKVIVPVDTDLPLSATNYSGNQGKGRNFRMSYFHAIAQEVEEARNNFPSLSQELSNTRNASTLNNRSGLSAFSAPALDSDELELVENYSSLVESGLTVKYDATNEAFKILSSGIYEIQANVAPSGTFNTSGYGQLSLHMDYDENAIAVTVDIDSAEAIFGENVYGVVQVEPEWSNVFIYFKRAGTYTGTIRGSVKFLNPLPSEVIPNIGGTLDGVPTITEILLNGIAQNSVSVIVGSSITIAAKFNGTASISGNDYNGVLSYGDPVVITPSEGTFTYTLSVTKNGRTIYETFTIEATEGA